MNEYMIKMLKKSISQYKYIIQIDNKLYLVSRNNEVEEREAAEELKQNFGESIVIIISDKDVDFSIEEKYV